MIARVIHRLHALDASSCQEIAAKVGELERFWTQRHPELPSFTLGAAAYLDVPSGGVHRYLVNKSRGNRILDRHFRPFLETVVQRLSEALEGPVFLTERYALPGFHVYGHHPELHRLEPSVHWDLQDMSLPDWEDQERAPGCSFTLPIAIPEGGAGVEIWDILYGSVSYGEACALADKQASTHHAYRLGELFVHSGNQLHKIASAAMPGEGEVRLTLQGHARKDTTQGWEVYW